MLIITKIIINYSVVLRIFGTLGHVLGIANSRMDKILSEMDTTVVTDRLRSFRFNVGVNAVFMGWVGLGWG